MAAARLKNTRDRTPEAEVLGLLPQPIPSHPRRDLRFEIVLAAQLSDQGPFSLVPELGLTLGYQVNGHWKATAGYTLLCWTNVVRPGDQIDTSVNPGLLPDEQSPITGALRPSFVFRDSSLWAQGLNLGLECAW